ncbi:hypothetical protein B0I32_1733 [Nonomuraea fuscirosea]|uniref:Uncharacterized protein n=1 Tax=Nonomuraea fuscirosea TaxID=1291556 RepID=A0A2T0LHC9_9ACTN|nr:hypothetical protein B0I32_1733 [Nonomuraea fuscirosea]
MSLNELYSRRGTVTVKSVTETCEILNAYDLTRSVGQLLSWWDAIRGR